METLAEILSFNVFKDTLELSSHCTKNEVFHKDLFSKCDWIRSFLEDLVTFTEDIHNGKFHFLCSVDFQYYTND